MTSAPISNEARGRTRVLLQELEASAAQITAAAARLPRKEIEAAGGFKKRSECALDALVARMPLAPYARARRTLVWRFLQPVNALPGATHPQPGIVMRAVLVGVTVAGLAAEPFGIAYTAHALGRLFDRGGPSVDPIAAMAAAHDALVALGLIEGAQVYALPSVTLPTPAGAFLAAPCRVGPAAAPLAVCRTWIDADHLHSDQAAHVTAWRGLLDPVPA